MFSPCLDTQFRFRVCSVFGGTQSFFYSQYISNTLSEKARKVPNHELEVDGRGGNGGFAMMGGRR